MKSTSLCGFKSKVLFPQASVRAPRAVAASALPRPKRALEHQTPSRPLGLAALRSLSPRRVSALRLQPPFHSLLHPPKTNPALRLRSASSPLQGVWAPGLGPRRRPTAVVWVRAVLALALVILQTVCSRPTVT